MLKEPELLKKFEIVFEVQQAATLAEVITDAYTDLVKTSDFNELKEIVRDLAQSQQRTEQRVEELARAQQRTEQRMEELAEAQTRTDHSLHRLEQVVEKGFTDLYQKVGTMDVKLSDLGQAVGQGKQDRHGRYRQVQ